MFKRSDSDAPIAAAQGQLENIQAQLDALSRQFSALSQQVEQAAARPRGVELLKKLGVTPERFLDRYFETLPDNALYEALYGGSESLRGRPGHLGLPSSLCRQLHFSTDEFRFWMNAMGRPPRMHRKEWEWFFIAQALFERGMLEDGKKGLAFAVGREPLPALFAALGCQILATDQAPDKAVASGWSESGMYSSAVESLNDEGICPRDKFFASVSYANLDMNDIHLDSDERFDFCWSSCAFEHLGSLEHGMSFVENSLDVLVSGGIAVHTTEFNLSSNDDTMETPGCSIFRRRDIDALVARLEAAGHHVEPFNWDTGPGFAETVVDLPPYKQSPHLRLKIMQYDCTSLGLIVRKK